MARPVNCNNDNQMITEFLRVNRYIKVVIAPMTFIEKKNLKLAKKEWINEMRLKFGIDWTKKSHYRISKDYKNLKLA